MKLDMFLKKQAFSEERNNESCEPAGFLVPVWDFSPESSRLNGSLCKKKHRYSNTSQACFHETFYVKLFPGTP